MEWWLAYRTRNREVVGSTLDRHAIWQQLRASCQHPCSSVTKLYNLLPYAAGKLTVGLASHWPCSGLSISDLNSQRKRDESPPPMPLLALGPRCQISSYSEMLKTELFSAHTALSNISSATGASDLNSRHMASPVNVLTFHI